jgi:ABC-type amino acid transport substrate-binding protein
LCNKNDGIKILKDLEINSIEYSSKNYKEYPLYLVFSKKERNLELAQRFSEALKKIKKSGEYKKIYE